MSPQRQPLGPLRSLLGSLFTSRTQSSFLGLVLLLACSACTSGPAASGSGSPTRLLLRDYRTMQEFEIVNDAYDDRIAFYSQKRNRGQTMRKFQSDGELNGMLGFLDDQGWGKYSQTGNAPSDGAAVITSAFELERDGKTTHWKIGNGSEADMRQAFLDCKLTFVSFYQATQGFQTVDGAEFDMDSGNTGGSR